MYTDLCKYVIRKYMHSDILATYSKGSGVRPPFNKKLIPENNNNREWSKIFGIHPCQSHNAIVSMNVSTSVFRQNV